MPLPPCACCSKPSTVVCPGCPEDDPTGYCTARHQEKDRRTHEESGVCLSKELYGKLRGLQLPQDKDILTGLSLVEHYRVDADIRAYLRDIPVSARPVRILGDDAMGGLLLTFKETVLQGLRELREMDATPQEHNKRVKALWRGKYKGKKPEDVIFRNRKYETVLEGGVEKKGIRVFVGEMEMVTLYVHLTTIGKGMNCLYDPWYVGKKKAGPGKKKVKKDGEEAGEEEAEEKAKRDMSFNAAAVHWTMS